MINNSQDILNIALSVSVFGVAVFLCWTLFYVIFSLRSLYKVIKEIQGAVVKISDLVRYTQEKIQDSAKTINDLAEQLKNKLNTTGSYLSGIIETIKNIFESLRGKHKEEEEEEDTETNRTKTQKKRKK
jgi:uncharacterized protein YoxC